MWSHLLWPPLLLQTITLCALSSPPCRWCRSWESIQNHNAFLLWNICFLSEDGGGQGPATCSYIFLCCHIAWQFILGRAGWHLRHKADKAPGVTSMRPVGAVTMPLAMQSYEMDNIALNILAKQEKRHQLFAHFHLQRETKQTRWLETKGGSPPRFAGQGLNLKLLWRTLGCFPGCCPMHAGGDPAHQAP